MGFNSAFKGLKPICHLLALLGAHHILQISRIRVKKCMVHTVMEVNNEGEGCSTLSSVYMARGKGCSRPCRECKEGD